MTVLERARAAWGGDVPDWVAALAAACEARSQGLVAARVGYSAAAVSQVLGGKYRGDLGRVEAAVRGALMGEEVECPVLGWIGRDQCMREQRRAAGSSRGDPVRRALAKACPGCANRTPRTGESHVES